MPRIHGTVSVAPSRFRASAPLTLSLPLPPTVPSVQGQETRLLLVRGQIRTAAARLRWEGARRRPVLQLGDPIGAERDGGREGGKERLKNCKQMETLRILGERSRDGSADIWMSAISICCLWDLLCEAWQKGAEDKFQEKEEEVKKRKREEEEEGGEEQRKPAQASLLLGWTDSCFISRLALVQQRQPCQVDSLQCFLLNVSFPTKKQTSCRQRRQELFYVRTTARQCTRARACDL